jgi:flagellar FliL protein
MADIVAQYLPQKKGPSMMVQIAVLLVMTIAAVGIGWFSGSLLGGEVPHDAAAAGAAPTAPSATKVGHDAGGAEKAKDDKGKGDAGPAASNNPLVINLPPITTNLAAPSDTWLRMEASIQLDQPNADPTFADTIQQDLLAFLRTVKLHQIEGASGFQHLKADLTERAAIRSDGHVKAVLIRTLLFE